MSFINLLIKCCEVYALQNVKKLLKHMFYVKTMNSNEDTLKRVSDKADFFTVKHFQEDVSR